MPISPRSVRMLCTDDPATRRPHWRRGSVVCTLLCFAAMMPSIACNRYSRDRVATDQGPLANQADGTDGHGAGAKGGVITSIGRDEYHAEAVVQEDGGLAVYTMGQDATRVHEVPDQVLTAYVKPPQSSTSAAMILKPDPLPGDAEKMTSRFSGELPRVAPRPSALHHHAWLADRWRAFHGPLSDSAPRGASDAGPDRG